jgi:hypothetical protein
LNPVLPFKDGTFEPPSSRPDRLGAQVVTTDETMLPTESPHPILPFAKSGATK